MPDPSKEDEPNGRRSRRIQRILTSRTDSKLEQSAKYVIKSKYKIIMLNFLIDCGE